MERYASLLSFDRQFSVHNSCMTVRTMDSGATKFSFARANYNFE